MKYTRIGTDDRVRPATRDDEDINVIARIGRRCSRARARPVCRGPSGERYTRGNNNIIIIQPGRRRGASTKLISVSNWISGVQV